MGSETQQASREALLRAPVPVFLVNMSLIQRAHSGQASVTPSECIRNTTWPVWNLELGLAATNPAFPGHMWPKGQDLSCLHCFPARISSAQTCRHSPWELSWVWIWLCHLQTVTLGRVPSLGLSFEEAGVHKGPPPPQLSEEECHQHLKWGLVQRLAPGTGHPLGWGSDILIQLLLPKSP